jgi:peptidoglycan/LPS O-acetylase OafA/YrhL
MNSHKYSTVIIAYLFLAFFSVPHLIDDFLFGVPAEFGLSVRFTQFLAGVFILLYMGIIIPLARGKKNGIYSAMGMGGFLALAGILKHIPKIIQPGPYWSGWFSEGLIIGMILSGLGVILAGIVGLRK